MPITEEDIEIVHTLLYHTSITELSVSSGASTNRNSQQQQPQVIVGLRSKKGGDS